MILLRPLKILIFKYKKSIIMSQSIRLSMLCLSVLCLSYTALSLVQISTFHFIYLNESAQPALQVVMLFTAALLLSLVGLYHYKTIVEQPYSDPQQTAE